MIRSALCLALMLAAPAVARADEHWTATSTTAIAITGNVVFASGGIGFANGAHFTLRKVAQQPHFHAEGDTVDAAIYQVTTPADPVLLNGNRLCGGTHPTDVTYVAIWSPTPLPGDGPSRTLAAFSGVAAPTGDQAGECGTYEYELAP